MSAATAAVVQRMDRQQPSPDLIAAAHSATARVQQSIAAGVRYLSPTSYSSPPGRNSTTMSDAYPAPAPFPTDTPLCPRSPEISRISRNGSHTGPHSLEDQRRRSNPKSTPSPEMRGDQVPECYGDRFVTRRGR